MKVEVLSTGTELLRGRTLDENFTWLARELERAGLPVRHHQTVDDHLERLVAAIRLAAARSDVVLLTGGLGPTEDDFTRRAAAEAFRRPLVFRPDLWRRIRARLRRHRGRRVPTQRRQAWLPRGAEPLPNDYGSAPGFALRQDGVFFAALPGPPGEMRPMFRQQVLPRLRRAPDFLLWEGKAFGLPEAAVDQIVRRVVGRQASYGVTVRGGLVDICVRVEGPRRTRLLRDLSRRLRAALGIHFLESDLPETVARRLRQTRTTLAVAESCTGGLISHLLTGVPGISEVFLEGVVTYSNASKIRRLGVPERLLERHGAVSAPVARAMALGVARTAGADLGLAVTGIAGPGGGSPAKPVGLCFLAVGERVERRLFGGDRRMIQMRAAQTALDLLRRTLEAEGKLDETMGVRARR